MASYETHTGNGRTAWVRPEWADAIASALIEGRGCSPAGEGGRGALFRFAYPGGTALIRQYRRGGVVRHFLKDAYILQNRAKRELELTTRLFEDGLPVPIPLGACWARRGVLVRGWLAIQELESLNLFEYLTSAVSETERRGVMESCGRLVRRFHDAGLYHADLNVRNVLVAGRDLYLIDFDRAVLGKKLPALDRARNLLRLRRSMDKNGVPPALFKPLCEGYGVESLPYWIDRAYSAKGWFSDLAAGRTRPDDR